MFRKVFQLVGLVVLATHVCSYQFNNIDRNMKYFAISVEYVVHKFNEEQDDEFAYKFLKVWRSQHQPKLTGLDRPETNSPGTIVPSSLAEVDLDIFSRLGAGPYNLQEIRGRHR
ncbi:cystatin-12-like isoform 2-T2 [Thomomys bottae]